MNPASSPPKKSPSPRPPRKSRRAALRSFRASFPTALERDTLLLPDAIAESVVQETERYLKADLPAAVAPASSNHGAPAKVSVPLKMSPAPIHDLLH
jgi:hypothetical protein